MIQLLAAFIVFSSLSFAGTNGLEALTVPETIRVTSSAPRKKIWKKLTEKEKKLATHLLAAANAGKLILFHQNHRHGILIKNVLESSLNANNIKSTKELLGQGFNEYLNYALKFEDQVGPYASANRKYVLKKSSPTAIRSLFDKYSPQKTPVAFKEESVKLLTDPMYELLSHPEDADGSGLELTGSNLYEHGITSSEVTDALKKGLKSNVNCRIVRGGPTGLKCQVQALSNPELPGEVRVAMTEVVEHLKKAVPYASTKHQASQLKYLISYLEKGDVEDFRQMNVEWVKDGTSSKVDFMMGYVEYYADYLTQIGSWESYVQIVDPETTKLSKNLSKNAQYFEDKMPYGVYKKKFPKGYAPPAMMVYYFQEISEFHSGGYNLPNYDDIRRDVGAKNVIRLDLPGAEKDPTTLKDRRDMYETFAPVNVVNNVMDNWMSARRTIVLLHEIIGHGSGTYNTKKYAEKEDPTTALGALGSSLEEQRADLTALVFGSDPMMVKVGMFKNNDEAIKSRNAMYDAYNANFLRDVSKQKSLSESHHRGHWLLLNMLLEKGAIAKASKDKAPLTNDNLVLKIVDYDKYQNVCRELLESLQDIKAERREDKLKELYAKYAPLATISEDWMQTIIQRGSNLAINAGYFEQPWSVEKGQVQVYGALNAEGIANYLGK